ncbi:zinc knuckle-domain-containing protein [Podospora didyma]|uniref:Zinc knuckle-domain-containing protein n=1 Tax=Podospora didyma TaxID=330526 RepID=A0AAE0NBV7_9PEZI|nr:zinc knuckle-domain-containing protein [Podospora didyma]
MFSSRGDRGPSKATLANVQCQKCLKRGHYSYECKAPPQERPYVPRPSRTQQLFNPKLLPKLSNEVPDGLQRKKGVADEELAKKEAERARKRQLEDDEDDEGPRDSPRRHRSPSFDSVSSISTRSPSPPPKPVSKPLRRDSSRDHSHQGRRRSYDSNNHSSRLSDSPERGASLGRRLPSPPRARNIERARREIDAGRVHGRASGRDYSRSRSPPRPPIARDDRAGGRYRDRDDHRSPPPRDPSPPPRERSLSPFSKRLALTQSMNMGR